LNGAHQWVRVSRFFFLSFFFLTFVFFIGLYFLGGFGALYKPLGPPVGGFGQAFSPRVMGPQRGETPREKEVPPFVGFLGRGVFGGFHKRFNPSAPECVAGQGFGVYFHASGPSGGLRDCKAGQGGGGPGGWVVGPKKRPNSPYKLTPPCVQLVRRIKGWGPRGEPLLLYHGPLPLASHSYNWCVFVGRAGGEKWGALGRDKLCGTHEKLHKKVCMVDQGGTRFGAQKVWWVQNFVQGWDR